jgi:hypothetical protein
VRVAAQLSKRCRARGLVREPGAGLVGRHQEAGDHLGICWQRDAQQALVELALCARGGTQVGRRGGKVVLVVVVESVKVSIEPPVGGQRDRQVAFRQRAAVGCR